MRFLLCCLVVVVLTGCQSRTDTPASPPAESHGADETAIHDDLAAAFAGDQPGPDAAAEGECFAAALLSTTTLAELREAGLLDDEYAVVAAFPELERDLAEKVADAQLGCTDFVDDSTRAGIYVTKGRLARQRYAGCLRRTLPPTRVRAAVLAGLMGDWQAAAIDRLGDTQARCARRATR